MSTKSLICPSHYLSSARVKQVEAQVAHFELFHSIDDVPWTELWTQIPANRNLLRPAYLRAIEQSHPEMGFRYVVFYENKQPIGMAYFQIIPLEWERLQAERSNGKRKWLNQLLQGVAKGIVGANAKLLQCGNIFITGRYAYHMNKASHEQILEKLVEASRHIRRQEKNIIASLLKDLQPEDDSQLSQSGYYRFFGDPNMVLTIQPHWKSMEDYKASMISKYRQRCKSAYKKSKAIICKEMSLADMHKHQVTIHQLFNQLFINGSFNLKEISSTYFVDLKAALGNDFTVFGYYLDEKLVAFSTSLFDGKRMEAHYVGYELSLNHDYKLYQRMLYDLVELSIKKEVKELSFGRTALEIKSCLGAQPEEFGLFLQVSNPIFNRLIGPTMRHVKPEPWEARHPFKATQAVVSTSSKKHSLHLGS